MPFTKYGASWGDSTSPLQVEMACIQRDGRWTNTKGVVCGAGLPHHYEAMHRILWPNMDGEHNGQRWHTLCRDTILNNKVTVLMGPGSTGKTNSAAWIYLCEYLCFPEETCVLVSSTHIDGLRLRVWGEITMLWQQAVTSHPWLPGHMLDSKVLLSTDSLTEYDFDERDVRDWRKGIKGVPCIVGGKFVGLSKFQGIKQKRMRLIGDELAAMNVSFLSAFSNLNKNVDFRAVLCGNPNDPTDALGKAAEPLDGWSSHLEPEKTTVWKTKFYNGACVNMIGTDSPNFDYPPEEPVRFPYLISAQKIADTLSCHSKDSYEYYSQCIGSMKIGVLARRVLSRDLCRQYRAQDDVIWKGTPTTKVYALDAAYGGDRCVGGGAEFGEDVEGNQVLSFFEPRIIPVLVGTGEEPEDQIARAVKADCNTLGIPPENMGHDATGRGSLGTALARHWSAKTNPVEFGGAPTTRPVSLDIFITDPKTKLQRLKLCNEHYDRFVTELWFSVRYGVEAGQIRNLPEEAIEEFCLRKWDEVRGKKSVEPKNGTATKPGMKQRVGRSPDMGDWASLIVEMARRKGFQVKKLANAEAEEADHAWLDELARKAQERRTAHTLVYS